MFRVILLLTVTTFDLKMKMNKCCRQDNSVFKSVCVFTTVNRVIVVMFRCRWTSPWVNWEVIKRFHLCLSLSAGDALPQHMFLMIRLKVQVSRGFYKIYIWTIVRKREWWLMLTWYSAHLSITRLFVLVINIHLKNVHVLGFCCNLWEKFDRFNWHTCHT